MNIHILEDEVLLFAHQSDTTKPNSLSLSPQGWATLRAQTPEAVALKKLLEVLTADEDETYASKIDAALDRKPELASAVREAHGIVCETTRFERTTPRPSSANATPRVEAAFLELLGALDVSVVTLTPELHAALKWAREVRDELRETRG